MGIKMQTKAIFAKLVGRQSIIKETSMLEAVSIINRFSQVLPIFLLISMEIFSLNQPIKAIFSV